MTWPLLLFLLKTGGALFGGVSVSLLEYEEEEEEEEEVTGAADAAVSDPVLGGVGLVVQELQGATNEQQGK